MVSKRMTVFALLIGTILSARTLTVDDLIQIALRHSPDVDLGRYDVAISRQSGRSARSVRLPQAGLSIRLEHQSDNLRHGPTENTETLEGTLSVTQLLYDFGKSAAEIESSRERESAVRARLRQIVSDKILEVRQRYYDALKAKTLIGVYEKNLRLQEKHLYRAKKYLKAGIKTAVDVTDAKLELEQARKSLNDARFLYRMKRALLEESLGTVPDGGAYHLYTPAGDPGSWRLPDDKRSLKSLLRYARKHRPILKGLEHEIRSADAYAKRKALHTMPMLELYGEAGAKGRHPSVSSGSPWSHEKAGVRMYWSLFSGYRESAESEAARLEALKARSYRAQAILEIRREVIQAHLNLRHKREKFLLNGAIVRQARQKYRQAWKRYANDLADYVELQDAQQDYIRALADRVNSYFEYFSAKAELEHAIGK